MAQRPFTIDLAVRRDDARPPGCEPVGRKDLGIYWYALNQAYVILPAILRQAVKYTGPNPPECLLERLVVETAVHESLHAVVRSSGKKKLLREHRAIARVMANIGMDASF